MLDHQKIRQDAERAISDFDAFSNEHGVVNQDSPFRRALLAVIASEQRLNELSAEKSAVEHFISTRKTRLRDIARMTVATARGLLDAAEKFAAEVEDQIGRK